MKIEIIGPEKALERANEIRELAFAIAAASDTLPGYCQAPECRSWCDYMAVTQLKKSERCVFIDSRAALQLTNFEVANQFVLGKICVENLHQARIEEERLCLEYVDGLVEYFTYEEQGEYWKFERNNANTSFKLANRNAN